VDWKSGHATRVLFPPHFYSWSKGKRRGNQKGRAYGKWPIDIHWDLLVLVFPFFESFYTERDKLDKQKIMSNPYLFRVHLGNQRKVMADLTFVISKLCLLINHLNSEKSDICQYIGCQSSQHLLPDKEKVRLAIGKVVKLFGHLLRRKSLNDYPMLCSLDREWTNRKIGLFERGVEPLHVVDPKDRPWGGARVLTLGNPSHDKMYSYSTCTRALSDGQVTSNIDLLEEYKNRILVRKDTSSPMLRTDIGIAPSQADESKGEENDEKLEVAEAVDETPGNFTSVNVHASFAIEPSTADTNTTRKVERKHSTGHVGASPSTLVQPVVKQQTRALASIDEQIPTSEKRLG